MKSNLDLKKITNGVCEFADAFLCADRVCSLRQPGVFGQERD